MDIDDLLRPTDKVNISKGRICCKGHNPVTDTDTNGYAIRCPKCNIKTFPRTYEKEARNDWNNKILY